MHTLDANSKLAGIFGNPVRHSLSPLLHNRAFQQFGINAVYLAFEVVPSRFPEVLGFMKSLNFLGANVTIPFKETAAAVVDSLSEDARVTGAVNTVSLEGDRAVGSNTDGKGFLMSLVAEGGFEPRNRRSLVIGAGGAARAVASALGLAGAAEVCLVNRTEAQADKVTGHLTERTGLSCFHWAPLNRLTQKGFLEPFDLVVNTIPPQAITPFPAENVVLSARRGTLFFDLAYLPEGSPFAEAASAHGFRVVGGLGMLVFQAGLSFQIWTGVEPPFQCMAEAAGFRLPAINP